MFELIRNLTGKFGVSGNEEEVRDYIKEEIGKYVDEVEVDALGSLIAVKRGTGKKIMVAAHMDEIGIMATYIDEKGYIRFADVGWVSQFYLLGQRVRFKNGAVGAVFYEEKLDELKNLKLSNMYVDIGAKSKEEAEKRVKIGETAVVPGESVIDGDMLISRALDDRAGCAVLIKALQNLPETDNELYFVFTVQEELGLRGAKTSAYRIAPDIAITVDVTMTGDTPECKPMEVKCGGGPAIKIKDRSVICHPEVKRLLEDSARRLDIPFQYEVLESGGSDAGAIHMAVGGIPTGAISIPCRYTHSPVEMASMSDIENAVMLLVESIK